jgi:hypothetical protein
MFNEAVALQRVDATQEDPARRVRRSVRQLSGFGRQLSGIGLQLSEADKHHRGMASANHSLGPREQESWCLPASLDILELCIQQHPTRRGDTD